MAVKNLAKTTSVRISVKTLAGEDMLMPQDYDYPVPMIDIFRQIEKKLPKKSYESRNWLGQLIEARSQAIRLFKVDNSGSIELFCNQSLEASLGHSLVIQCVKRHVEVEDIAKLYSGGWLALHEKGISALVGHKVDYSRIYQTVGRVGVQVQLENDITDMSGNRINKGAVGVVTQIVCDGHAKIKFTDGVSRILCKQ